MEHIVTDQPKQPLGTFKTIGLILGAVIAFTMAYSGPHCWILMLAFVWCILTLARRGTTRSAFYGGWTMGLVGVFISAVVFPRDFWKRRRVALAGRLVLADVFRRAGAIVLCQFQTSRRSVADAISLDGFGVFPRRTLLS